MNLENLKKEIASLEDEFIKIRHELHKNPELGFKEVKTSNLISQKLKEFGYEVYENIGKTGVVGVLKKGKSNKKIGLRADMDALPIKEETTLSYKSTNDNMHACGHDGHSSSLLMAAKYLSKKEFNGTLNLYFQPAEEGLGGADAMIEDGLFSKFDSDFVFSWHNMPFNSKKKFYLKKGAMMASCDDYELVIKAKSGHASSPHKVKDPIYIGSLLVVSLQGIVSRNTDPQSPCVLSICSFHAGDCFNVVPDKANLLLNVRTLNETTRALAEQRIRTISQGLALAHEVEIEVIKKDSVSVLNNDQEASEFALSVAKELFGEQNCEEEFLPLMASEDFASFSKVKKTAYAFLDNENSIYLHNSSYVFNDKLLTQASSYYASLVLRYLV